MDSMTHIHFAANLLATAGKDFAALDGALFPQIDRKPAYYHRLYAHSIPKAEPIARAARDVYWETDARVPEDDYLRSRLLSDRERIKSYTTASPFEQPASRVPDATELILTIISHIYNDQFNNPIQAFVPYSVYPSGAWSLWESIDSAEFRWFLYEKNTIDQFREEVFSGSEWRASLSSEALGAAMIARLAKACTHGLEQSTITATLTAAGVADAYRTDEYDDAFHLLELHDQRVFELIRKYALPRQGDGPRKWAGHGY